jgi:putative DNA primase/helicase
MPREEPPANDDGDDDRDIGTATDELMKNPFFEILGFDHSTYFFFHKNKQQVMEYDRSQFADSTFIELAPPTFWQRYFSGGSKKEKFDKQGATAFLMKGADSRGIYDPERLRGRGAWADENRMVYHHGDFLTVDTKRQEIGDFKSRYIYEMQRSLPLAADEPLTDEEGAKLLDLASDFRWTKAASGALLCGWLMLAPICGALRWRPHIWLSGGAGTGKSTLLNDFMHPLLNGLNLFAQGNTTEAGMRQKLRTDALPILFEESEQNEEKDRTRMQHVLSLIRQSSTESHARVFKGTMGGHSMEFLVRSMFCLASIQVGIKHQADIERITVLSLRPKKDPTRDTFSEWEKLRERLYETIGRNPQIGPKLMKRAMALLPTIKRNVEVFSTVCAKKFGSAREGDQYGALLAGTWSMSSSQVATDTDAYGLIQAYSWEEHRDAAEIDEGQLALSALMGNRLRAPRGMEYTVHELTAAANGNPVNGVDIDKISAEVILGRYGMIVKNNYLLLSNSSVELRDTMAHTNYAADWRGVLLRIPGADRNDNKSVRFSGVASKCIRIPLEPVTKMSEESIQQSWLAAEQPIER